MAMSGTQLAAEKNKGNESITNVFMVQDFHHIKEFVCGWGAAFINISITFPIHKVIFRQMLHAVPTHVAFGQLRKEGIRNLYRGILPPLIQKTTSLSIMFGMYDRWTRILESTFPHVSINLVKGLAAVLAGSTEAILTPFERVQTLLQDSQHQKRFINTYHTLKEVRFYGLKEYYRGLTPILLRNGPSNALFFGLRGPLKNALPEVHSGLGHLIADFISGAVLGAMISTLYYPINVVKTHMQSHLGGPFVGFIKSFQIVLSERNYKWRNLFLGVHINYTRSLISWGIINASYEFLKKALYNNNDSEDVLRN